MSKKSETFEEAIKTIAEENCFDEVLSSMDNELVEFFELSPGVKIEKAEKIVQDSKNKTDVLLELSNQKKIKIIIKKKIQLTPD